MGSWMKDLQERVRKASTDVNTALQPRMAQAKRQLEEGIEQMGLKRGKELYADDAPLASALAALDVVRMHVRALAVNVDAQRGHLLAAAKTQRVLGEMLGSAAPPDAQALIPSGGGRDVAHAGFAEAQLAAASASARFALDMSTPMADLARTFEEQYSATISPLKKRHASQKTEYLKFVRQARAATDDTDPGRRERLETVARNAQPVCQRTSESLQSEIRSLLAHTMSSISEWMLNVAQAQAETYARAAKAFEEPKQLAEKAQDVVADVTNMAAIAAKQAFSLHAVRALALSADGSHLAASYGRDSSTLVITPLPSIASLPSAFTSLSPAENAVSAQLAPITALSFDANSRVYTADARGALSLYALSDDSSSLSQRHHVRAAHSGVPLTGVAAAPSLVATSGKDGLIKAWDPSTASCIARLKGHKGEARAVCIAETPESHLLASAGRDRSVRLWDVRAGGGGPVAVFSGKDGHEGWVHDVAMCAGPRPRILSCGGDKIVRVWDLTTMRLEAVCRGHQYRVWTVAAAPLGQYAVSGSTDSTVRCWQLDDTSAYSSALKDDKTHGVAWEGHGDSVLAVSVARNSSFAVSASENGSVIVWDVERMSRPVETDGEAASIASEAVENAPRHVSERSWPASVSAPRDNSLHPPMNKMQLPVASKDASVVNQGFRESSPGSPERPIPVRSRRTRTYSPRSQSSRVLSPRSPSRATPEAEVLSTSAISDAGAAGEVVSPDSTRLSMASNSGRLASVSRSPSVSAGRIRFLEEQVALRDLEIAARDARLRELEEMLAEREKDVKMLQTQVESAHNLVKHANVRALSAETSDRTVKHGLSYTEPIDRISRVTGQLKELASKLDGMSIMS